MSAENRAGLAGRCREQGNGVTKGRSFSRRALDPHLSAHELDQPFADGQTEPSAAVLPRDRTVRLAERLKELVHFFRADADAGIAHGKAQLDPITVRAYFSAGRTGQRTAGQTF